MAKPCKWTSLFALVIMVLAVIMAHAQEPRASILVNGEVPNGFYKAGIRYGKEKGDSLFIRWSRNAEADTFWVYKGTSSLEYITSESIRTVFHNQPMRYERRMAIHHLRETVLNTPLRFNDFEALAKGQNPFFLKNRLAEYFTR